MMCFRRAASPLTYANANIGNNASPSAHARLLPFLEQQPLYDALNWSLPVINDPMPPGTGYGPYANSTVTITRLDGVPLPVRYAAELELDQCVEAIAELSGPR